MGEAMSAGAWFKAITNQKPTPAREREVTDELIERQAKRIAELERLLAELTNRLSSYAVAERAGREWWAQTRHTNGPRILEQYASREIMDGVHNTAKIIIQAAIKEAKETT